MKEPKPWFKRWIAGASLRDVLNLVHELDEKGASLRVLEPEVTTAGSMGRMVITILGMVADMELKFIKDRQKAGIDAAKAEGVYKGRKKNADDAEIRKRIAAGVSKAAVARDLNVSRMTIYRALEAKNTSPDSISLSVHHPFFELTKIAASSRLGLVGRTKSEMRPQATGP